MFFDTNVSVDLRRPGKEKVIIAISVSPAPMLQSPGLEGVVLFLSNNFLRSKPAWPLHVNQLHMTITLEFYEGSS